MWRMEKKNPKGQQEACHAFPCLSSSSLGQVEGHSTGARFAKGRGSLWTEPMFMGHQAVTPLEGIMLTSANTFMGQRKKQALRGPSCDLAP